jgi:hypothetical protein
MFAEKSGLTLIEATELDTVPTVWSAKYRHDFVGSTPVHKTNR